MIATGGTIASKNSGAGLAPALTAKELLASVPEIGQLCRVTEIQPFNLDSTNVFYAHWLEIARLVEENYDTYDGFLITHGTDTMAYTAAALSYLIQESPKPIVLTGSQKSVFLRDTDARANLLDAFSYCVDDGAHGVKLVFDGQVILGTRAKKTHTRSYNAFTSVDFPPVAVMRDGKPFYYLTEERPNAPRFYHALDPDIFVLKMFPGMKAEILGFLATHCDGLILETFGSGGLPEYGQDAFFRQVKEFTKQGKTVVVTTQVEREGSALESYEVGRRLKELENVLEARSMTVEATVAKLMWILAQTKDPARIRALFNTPIEKDIF